MKTSSAVQYRENRSKVPEDELRKFDGKWVAFSADGLRIVAGGSNLADLSTNVRAANEDMQDMVVEHIKFDNDEIHLRGAEVLWY